MGRYIMTEQNEFQKRIGVGEPFYGIAMTGQTRRVKVVAEEGDRKGKTAAVLVQHGDGRQDASVMVDSVRRTYSISGNYAENKVPEHLLK
jgi:hypothetical protein